MICQKSEADMNQIRRLRATSAFKCLRQARQLTLYDLQEETGVHYVTAHRIERGLQLASRMQARKLAAALDVDLEAIFLDTREGA